MGQADVPALPIGEPERFLVPIRRPRTVYSSPLTRALTTAATLFPGETPIVDGRLMERDAGEWEGMGHRQVRARWPEAFVQGHLNPDVDPPGGESLEQFTKRVASFLKTIAPHPADHDLFVVTHNGWIRVARHLNGEIPMDRLFAEQVPFMRPIALDLSSALSRSGDTWLGQRPRSTPPGKR